MKILLNIALLLLIVTHQAFCSFEFTIYDYGCGPSSIAPSSCANQDIRYPFRLKGQPTTCSDPRYVLSCENNNTTLLYYPYLGGHEKYYVQKINYEKKTIRLIDSGIQEDNYSFIPRFFINRGNFSYRRELSKGMVVIVNCEKPIKKINSISYLPLETSTCSENINGSASTCSPYSKKHLYLLFGKTNVMDLEDSCKIVQMSLTSWPGPIAYQNISCTHLRNVFLSGFELRWVIIKNGAIITLIRDIATGIITKVGCSVFLFWRGGATVFGTPFIVAFFIYKWRRRHLSMYDAIEEFLQNHSNLMTIRYSFAEIKKMTRNFKEKLGEGGYGTVFKGTLQSGSHVAVKLLGKSKTNGQEFINEVATIGRIHHVNVVQLIGFCVHRSKRALVYEFMPHGSLNKYIFSSEGSVLLNYEKTYNIALGVAHGIEYLHRGCDMQILHFDIKPHNILLDENFTPKVSDFGLAKLCPIEANTISLTAARGTLGYMAPELFYKNIGGISYKADVYSFGMLLMEMVGKRKNLNAFAENSSQIYFPTWVYDKFNNEKDIEMGYAMEEEKKMSTKMIIVALWCIQTNPSNRPSMNKVIEMLEGEVEHLQIPPKPPLSSPERVTKDCELDNSSQTWTSTS